MSMNKPDYEQAFADGLAEVAKIKSAKGMDSEKTTIPKVNPKTLRASMGISQQVFAEKFGIPLATLRNWEQGRTDPDAPTSVLLYLISRFPELVATEIGKLHNR